MASVRAVAAQHAHLLGRKGAARIALIPDEVLQALNRGAIPTANLNEFLAIDLTHLAPAVAQSIGLDARHERLQDTLAMLASFKPMKRHGLIAHALHDMTLESADPDAVAQALVTHPSDVARCWASDWVRWSGWPLARQLQAQQDIRNQAHHRGQQRPGLAVHQAQQALAAWSSEHPAMVVDFERPYRCERGARA